MQKLRDNLLKLLARREYSQKELMLKMQSKGFEVEQIEEQIARLAEVGLQSDERYAEMLTEHYVLKGKGPFYLRQKLREKGLNQTIVEASISAMDVDEALKNALYRLRRYDGVLRRRRLVAWGFSTEEME